VHYPDGTSGRLLDFGCGVGAVTPYLLQHLNPSHLTGSDLSEASLTLARKTHASDRVDFCPLDQIKTLSGTFDLAHCNGVFHHIPLAHRLDAARSVFDALRPGGHFCFWENNKWNPIVHYMILCQKQAH
jgi:SAM-dependent methyltransferase